MPKYPWIQIPLCVLVVVGPLMVVYARLFKPVKTTDKEGKIREGPRGIGARMLQLIAMLVLPPLIVLLALEGTLSMELTGTLLGGIAGYALSGISGDDSN
jgi:hypothetical protein